MIPWSGPAARVVEHPLGKGEVVSSILTGSTRNRRCYRASCIAFEISIRQQSAERNAKLRLEYGENPGTLFRGRSSARHIIAGFYASMIPVSLARFSKQGSGLQGSVLLRIHWDAGDIASHEECYGSNIHHRFLAVRGQSSIGGVHLLVGTRSMGLLVGSLRQYPHPPRNISDSGNHLRHRRRWRSRLMNTCGYSVGSSSGSFFSTRKGA